MELLIFIIILYVLYRFKVIQFIWYLLTKPSSQQSNISTKQVTLINTSNIYTWPSSGNYEFEVVGESYYQPAINKLAAGQSEGVQVEFDAILTPDDFNKFDNKAVKVEINGLQVGNLSREDARSFRRRLGNKKLSNQITSAKAIIIGGHEDKKGNKMHYGVMLDMKPFDS